MKRYSTYLSIREIQKSKEKYPYSVRMSMIKNVGEDVESTVPLYGVGGNEISTATLEVKMEIFLKTKSI